MTLRRKTFTPSYDFPFRILFMLIGLGVMLCYNITKEQRTLIKKLQSLTSIPDPIDFPQIGTLISVQSKLIDSKVSDIDFGVIDKSGLILNRKTEYCQWKEESNEDCQKRCQLFDYKFRRKSHRIKSPKCECHLAYSYTTGWFPYLINSTLFNQPAEHFNSQLDPFPSSVFYPTNGVTFDTINSDSFIHIGESQLTNLHSEWECLEDINASDVIKSRAHKEHFFTYNEGYFMSPYYNIYQNSEQLLMGTCDAGDIRISFQVKNPSSISVIGEVTHQEEYIVFISSPSILQNDTSISTIYGGTISSEEMIKKEISKIDSGLFIGQTICTLVFIVMLIIYKYE
jgi:hypothetical protein